jgi:tRNA pseudouridine32 synthase / 23S rRNA pseudouridine746 synthase
MLSGNCFTPFKSEVKQSIIPLKLNNPFEVNTPKVCEIAAQELQEFISEHETVWTHNFGLSHSKGGPVKSKMFGVLVVRNTAGELGYLCTFSGKLADLPHHPRFVPSVFDISTDNFFINRGMTELTQIGDKIKTLETSKVRDYSVEINELKRERKVKSKALQQQLFDSYQFLNQKGESKYLTAIFAEINKYPPAAAGECAAPKLLQYAFKHDMKPLAIAEFWWGKSSTSEKKHGQFYPACNDKCIPILGYMLA